jgi:hypothetical protein
MARKCIFLLRGPWIFPNKDLKFFSVKMISMFQSGTQNYRSMGEITLQWLPLRCQIILLFKGVHA